MKAFFSQGPNLTLVEEDVKKLREQGYADFDFLNINGILRISVVDGTIPPRHFCDGGINIRRYPEGISPHDYKGRQFWVARISRERFETLINSESDGERQDIVSRCKYDRFLLGYLKF